MTPIEIENLSVKYAGRKRPTLEGVNLALRPGETTLILGASGSGKSTLALTLNGLIPHSLGAIVGGAVRVGGIDTQASRVAELAQTVGIVFQDPEAQFVTLTVEDELLFGLENLCVPPQEMDARVDAALAAVGMGGWRRRRVDRLSGGQKQRVALAALLALGPRVLVFDEPTANLDPRGTREVFALLAELKARGEHTIVLIEHKLDALMHLIDRVVVLGAAGVPLADGPPRTVFDRDGDLLEREGVWLPQVTLLARRLRGRGMALAPFPMTLADADAALADHSPARGATRLADARDRSATTAPAAPPVIEVRGLSFSYGPQAILRDIALTIRRGEFVALVGANGAGKTTLAQHLVGIVAAPRGIVLLEGKDVGRLRASEIARRVGYVFQNPEHQFVTDSALDEVAYGLRTLGQPPAKAEEQAAALLERFGLARYARANPFTLSHGEKRRLSVATMLAMGQDLLILDEPTFGQDERNARELLMLLRELHAEGRTVIVVTHDMALVAEHAARVVALAEGRIIFDGTSRDLFARPALLAAAHLAPPPIAELSARLAARDPRWPAALTTAELADAATGRSAGAVAAP